MDCSITDGLFIIVLIAFTVGAWRNGWKYRALIPWLAYLGLYMGLPFLLALLIPSLELDTCDFVGGLSGRVVAVAYLVHMTKTPRKKEDGQGKAELEEQSRKTANKNRPVRIIITMMVLIVISVPIYLNLENNSTKRAGPNRIKDEKRFEDNSIEQGLREIGMDIDLAESLAEALQSVTNKAARNGGISLEEIDEIAKSSAESMRLVVGKPEGIPLEKLKEMAERGDVNAQYQLGNNYYSGKGVPKDYKEAVKWCKMAGEQGHAFAHSVLRAIAIDGKAISGEELFAWFKNQAEQGNVKAHFSIGVMYENGETVARNRKEAIKWFKLAAEQGDDEAQVLLNLIGSGF